MGVSVEGTSVRIRDATLDDADLLDSWMTVEAKGSFNDFGMPRPNDPTPGLVSPYYAALDTRLKELKLDVERLAPSHGRAVVPYSQFANLVQGKVQAPAPRPVTESR